MYGYVIRQVGWIMSYEPFGYGNRWYDRMARRKRSGMIIVGIGMIVVMIVAWVR